MHHAENASEKTDGGDLPQLFLRPEKEQNALQGRDDRLHRALRAADGGPPRRDIRAHGRGPVRPPGRGRHGLAVLPAHGADRGVSRHVRQRVQHVFESVPVQGQRPAAVAADPGALRDGLAPAGRVPAGADVRRGRHRAGRDRVLAYGTGHGGDDRRRRADGADRVRDRDGALVPARLGGRAHQPEAEKQELHHRPFVAAVSGGVLLRVLQGAGAHHTAGGKRRRVRHEDPGLGVSAVPVRQRRRGRLAGDGDRDGHAGGAPRADAVGHRAQLPEDRHGDRQREEGALRAQGRARAERAAGAVRQGAAPLHRQPELYAQLRARHSDAAGGGHRATHQGRRARPDAGRRVQRQRGRCAGADVRGGVPARVDE